MRGVDTVFLMRYNGQVLAKGKIDMSVIMFVCTANICRSPMAAGLLRQRLAEEGLDTDYQVISVGVQAEDGRPVSKNAMFVMAERWVDITDHVARAITAEDVARSDLILVMAREHEQVIRQMWPQYAWKVRRLSEMVGKRQDVKDPYGGSIEKYEESANVLSDYIREGFERILELA
jgi:protein-tyrosine-phosphatase